MNNDFASKIDDELIISILDAAVQKAKQNIQKEGVISLQDAIPLLLRGQFNHIRHLEEKMLTKEELNAVKIEINNEINSVKKDIASLENKIGSLEKKTDSLENKIGSLENKIGSVENEVHSIKGEITSVKSEIKILKSDIKTLKWITGIGLAFLALLISILSYFTIFVK